MATQKPGRDCPRTAINFTPWSQNVSRRVAAMIPRKKASSMAMTKAGTVSLRVLGSDCAIISLTGFSLMMESPRLPRARSVM
jgi:hypothetical protein